MGRVWIQLYSAFGLRFCVFFFFFFCRCFWLFNLFTVHFSSNSGTVHNKISLGMHTSGSYLLFTDPQTSLFSNFFIKNGSHDTIYTFKNYFATVFSVFSFQFQQNKFYPNRPLILWNLNTKKVIHCVCLYSRLLRCVSLSTFSPFFFFVHAFSPHKRLLFIYCTWTVTTTFDQFYMNSAFVHCLQTNKFHFLSIFSLKMGPTILFTHLKIILLQCFQFSVFNFNKISSIQTHP